MTAALKMVYPRDPQATNSVLPSQIGRPDESSSVVDTILHTASAPESVYTTFTQPWVVTYISAGVTSVGTTERPITVTDAASYSSLAAATAQRSTLSTVSSVSPTRSSAAASSTTAHSDGPSNSSVLIPAIVAPVGAVLVLTFGLFWWFMRRRARRAQSTEPEFVMEKRSSKPLTRGDSTHSHSSTRKLVSHVEQMSMAKDVGFHANEIDRHSFDLFPAGGKPPVIMNVGVAHSPNHTPSHSRQISREGEDPSGPPLVPATTVRNFSRGPSRPSTGTKESDPGAAQFSRDRGLSSPGIRPSTQSARPVGLPSNPSPHPNRSDQRGQHDLTMRGAPNPGPRSGPRPPPSAYTNKKSINQKPKLRQHQPAPLQTEVQSYESTALSPPTPTGAYNGASPISQYSPIIKDAPRFGTSPTVINPNLEPSLRKGPPSAIKTGNGSATQNSDFSEENMRIARLANNSRLGFNKTTSPTTVHHTVTSSNNIEPPSPSPRLPPPATREAPPSNMGIPIPPNPVETGPAPSSRRADSFANTRQSVVSRLSSDDGYVDMEVDAKSEVSSLDDDERWQMDQDAGHESRTAMEGLGGYGAIRPPQPIRGDGAGSEASGSQYSVNKY